MITIQLTPATTLNRKDCVLAAGIDAELKPETQHP